MRGARDYFRFTGRARLDKAINSLMGLMEGIGIDGRINSEERKFLRLWLDEHEDLRAKHPMSELIPAVEESVADGVLTDEERLDLTWLCEKLRSKEYYDRTTADMQRLHAVMAGIMADGIITEEELRGLSDWLSEHEHLKTCWPYDEVASLVTAVMADGKIDPEEHRMLVNFFSEFVALLDSQTIVAPKVAENAGNGSLVGLCAVCPEISFAGSRFCFTGESAKYTRSEISDLIRRLGGEPVSGVSAKLDYLVIGANGNPCWAYACYGRKVEKAVQLRKQGARILLIHENDFHDAVADHG